MKTKAIAAVTSVVALGLLVTPGIAESVWLPENSMSSDTAGSGNEGATLVAPAPDDAVVARSPASPSSAGLELRTQGWGVGTSGTWDTAPLDE